MKNMSIEKERIHIDYSAADIPESVKNFQPDVYRDGDLYCLILGASEEGIFSCADTLEAAMQKWDEAYRQKKGQGKDGTDQ